MHYMSYLNYFLYDYNGNLLEKINDFSMDYLTL